MTAGMIEAELRAIGQQLNRWQAQHRAVLAAAAVLTALAVAAVADILWHLERPGRLVAIGVVVLLAGTGLVLIGLALAARRTPESVAARIEHCFPELDNHLINVVQFAHRPAPDELIANYVRQGVPQWSGLDRRQLRNRRQHRRAWIALGIAALVVFGPALWTGAAWSNALARVLNPFSQRPASTLARILELQPGDQVVTTGQPVTFTCRVTGKRNQEVWLDLWPADDRGASIKLGSLGQAASAAAVETPAAAPAAGESFRYVLPKLTSDLDYRLRAGDARSPRHRLTVRAPLALTTATLEVQPPAYTKLPSRTVDVLTEIPVVFQGADVAVRIGGNRPLRSASIAGQLAAAAGDLWTVTLPAFAGRSIPIAITATDGERLELDLACEPVSDRAPQVRVIAPQAKTTLTPGATPTIQYEVTDDFGVGRVALQTTAGETIEEWAAGDQPQFGALWNGPALGAGKTVSYRIVAWDHAHKAQSATIVFDTMNGQQLLAAAARNSSETANTLSQLLILQRQNLEITVQLRAGLPGADPAGQWSPLRDTQGKIRQIAGQLLADPRKPLGALGPLVHDLHRTAMIEAVDALARVPTSTGETQAGFADQAVALETQILRVLANTKDSLGRVDQHRQISGLLALLDALVSSQEAVLAATQAAIPDAARLPKGLVTRQDALAGDVSEFVQACHTEAQRLQNTDAEFAQLVRQVADGCGTREVRPNMLRAAEHLEQAQPADAVPFQDQALAALRDFQRLLNQWRIEQAQDAMTTVQQAVAEAAKKFDKLVELQAKVVDSLREIEPQEDLSGKPDRAETMEELKALKANITDAALKIATDLHIFPELPVGNELVEDVYQVFEEVVQEPGSADAPADELGLQKEDFILEMMENIKERFDDMEAWLTAKPDAMKRLAETFDQEEMPKMAVIPLPEELEDVIGELMEQQEEITNESDDSATNQAAPDIPAGWDTVEGEWSVFSGKGKSGNERPEHRDQDGRSLVGRQGMSDGETVAGSGKINEGDENIETRRTQDSAQAGRVEEEDHAEAKATGGGKQSGWAEGRGMQGEGPRRDSDMAPSELGLQEMLRRDAEAVYARASALHIRTGNLDDAVVAMRDAEQALRDKRPIQQVREFQRRAMAALKRTQADLNAGFSAEGLQAGPRGSGLTDQLAGVPEEAPPGYRDLVAEYFKSLGSAP